MSLPLREVILPPDSFADSQLVWYLPFLSRQMTSRLCSLQANLHPLANQAPLELRHSADKPNISLPCGVVMSRLSVTLTNAILRASNSASALTR
jgi:hypothetical protein